MKKQHFFILIALMAVFYACSKENVTPDPKVGDTWDYRYVDYNEDGSIASEDTITLTTTEIIIEDVSWVKIMKGNDIFGIYRMASNGLHRFNNNNLDELFLVYPGAVGDSAIYYYNVDVAWSVIKDINASVTVPAGMFDCYYYEEFDDNSIEGKFWFNEQHWLLRQQEFDQNMSGDYMDYMMEMISHTEG